MGWSNSGSLRQKLASFIHAVSLFLISVFSHVSRLKKLWFWWDKDMIFLEAERGSENDGDKSELHLKFKFPTFEEFSVQKRPVSAFIEVLTNFPADKNGELLPVRVYDETAVEDEEEEGVVGFDAEELEENKVQEVDGCDLYWERRSSNSDGFLCDGDFGEQKEEERREMKREKEDEHDANKLESLWEHQELIEQLEMELRKVKAASGLPTILEESESPKMVDDLRPWKIEEMEKHQQQDCMGEMYKSYKEMMRKFDILNYQKMYAMGFLQLKDPFQATTHQKPNPAPKLKSLVSQNIWLFKHKKHGTNPIKKLINEVQGDLEMVYVGQMCLSWEFLHCQHHKSLELWSSDPHGVHRYNEVAAEFQQFQVLLHRFTEDQPFQGPRIQTYVKTRCVLRNLLQVPVIREDCLEEDKMMDEYAITSEMLVAMMEESIRIFWQFVRSDMNCSTIASHTKLTDLHSPQDLKLLIELRKILQKKERKLKDILRSESCILRKLRKRREEDDWDQALQFFAQVDVKLVCRVLNMSRITRDQLIWCQNVKDKLDSLTSHNTPQLLNIPSPYKENNKKKKDSTTHAHSHLTSQHNILEDGTAHAHSAHTP